MAAPIYYTAEMVRALPDDGNRYETVHGELVPPDLFVVPTAEVRTLDWSRLRRLELVVEVLGPGTARADRFTKRGLYQEMHVPAYWVVDADGHFVEAWTPEIALPRVERERVEWLPAAAVEPFVLSLEELFRPV